MQSRSLLSVLTLLLVLAGCDAAESQSPRLYGDAEVDYFLEVALGTEFGSNTNVIRKWSRDIDIQVSGTPTAQDLDTLTDVVADLNALVDAIEIRVLVDDQPGAEAEIVFAPASEFGALDPNYEPGNLGFFTVRWTAGCSIVSSRVLISSDGLTQRERSHLIREELTQTLGLMRDSFTYPASIFYQPWTDVTAFAPVDEAVIEMLYRPEVRPCMTGESVRGALVEIVP